MYIPPTETLTRKDIDKGHFGISDIRIHQTGHQISWKVGEKGSATLEIHSGKPEDGPRWARFSMAEYAKNSSKETYMTINEQSARIIYEYLHQFFGKDQQQ